MLPKALLILLSCLQTPAQSISKESFYKELSNAKGVLLLSDGQKESSLLVQDELSDTDEQMVVGVFIKPNSKRWKSLYPGSSGSSWKERPFVDELGNISVHGANTRYTDMDYNPTEVLTGFNRFKNLRSVNLSFCAIADQHLKVLPMAKLEYLNLSNTDVSDSSINSLLKAQDIKSLWLTDCKISNKSAEATAKTKNLESLHLGGTQIDGHLELASTSVLRLHLHNTSVNDDVMHFLSKNTRIEFLDVSATKVSSKGLLVLRNLLSLKEVCASNCSGVSGPEIAALNSFLRERQKSGDKTKESEAKNETDKVKPESKSPEQNKSPGDRKRN